MVNCAGIGRESDETIPSQSMNDLWMQNSTINALLEAFPGKVLQFYDYYTFSHAYIQYNMIDIHVSISSLIHRTINLFSNSDFDINGAGKLEEKAREQWRKFPCSHGTFTRFDSLVFQSSWTFE